MSTFASGSVPEPGDQVIPPASGQTLVRPRRVEPDFPRLTSMARPADLIIRSRPDT